MGDGATEPRQPGRNEPPRRPSDVLKIRILSVVLVLVLVAFALYGLASEGVFDEPDDPYPMQDTPLTLQSWGVTWSRDYNESLNDVPFWAYANISVSMTEYLDGITIGRCSPFSCEEFIDISAFSVPATLDEAEDLSPLGYSIYFDGEVEVRSLTTYFVSDATDPEVFNAGDTISFIHIVFRDGSVSSVGFPEDIVYELEFYCMAGGMEAREGYGIAIHDGQLYSWIDQGPVDDPLS